MVRWGIDDVSGGTPYLLIEIDGPRHAVNYPLTSLIELFVKMFSWAL